MFKSAKSKVGLGLIIFGVISIIITQSANNGTSFGQSLLVASIFFVIGVVLLLANKKKKTPERISPSVSDVQRATGMVIIYPGSNVYHTNDFCVDSPEVPLEMSEEKAIVAGYRKCKRCTNYYDSY